MGTVEPNTASGTAVAGEEDKPKVPKLGLALSGGGHRAAFFHIGVLAKLAELGLLREIEVISTVSGGSIVGALYYLHVKNVLEDKPDHTITDADFVEIVRSVEHEYRVAVASDVRGSAWSSIRANFRMATDSRYSRTDRAGQLYEQRFYADAWRGRPRWNGRIRMRDLLIQPHGHSGAFDPDEFNAGRQAKVPILLLEATTLNTGHNWRFEAAYMGESPMQHCREGRMRADVDKNTILERTAWDALPEACQNFPLGAAVVSSACFPGGFPPMEIHGVFHDFVVNLVDGGVHDNQGIEGLIDRKCTHLIVSDGSGQMPDKLEPSTRLPAVLSRIVSIYGDAEREERLLAALEHPKRTAFVHLQTGLPARSREPGDDEETQYEDPKLSSAAFGVHREVQRALAKIRTDLDAFSDTEAFAIEANGYQLAGTIIPSREQLAALGQPGGQVGWAFSDTIPKLGPADPDPRFLKLLQVGKERFLKPARMFWHGYAAMLVILAALSLAAIAGLWLLATPHGKALFLVGLVILGAVILYFLSDKAYVRPVAGAVFDVLVPFLLAAPLFLAAWAQIGAGWWWRQIGRATAEEAPAAAALQPAGP